MLRGLDPLLSPDLLHALASMGHGDVLAIVDANFPAVALGRRVIALPGVKAPRALAAVMSVFPIDDFQPTPIRVMQVVDDPDAVPEAVREFVDIVARHEAPPPEAIERQAFYTAAQASFAVVQTGERRLYGNILLTKGVIRP